MLSDQDKRVGDGNSYLASDVKCGFVDSLHNAIWPTTDIDVFLKLLDEGGKECLDMRHGPRHETCLHR